MMWKLAVLLLIVSVKDATAVCSCYEAGNYTGKSAPMSNAYNTDDFSACFSAACSYVAYSGDDTYGWTGLTFNWGSTTGSSGLIQVFDGLDTTGTPIIQVQEGENVLSGSTKSLIKSSSPRITIRYTQSGSSANVYYGVIKAVPGLQPSAAPTTSTAAPASTTPYSNPNYKHNPASITHDVMIVVNQKTSGGITALNNLNAIAINFVQLLSTTTDVNSASSSRLSLVTLTPYDPYYAVRGTIWGLTSTDLISSLPKSGVTIEGNIDQALSGLVDLAFKVNTNSSTDSRRNVQRSIILLTAEWPSTGATLSSAVHDSFTARGVDLFVMGFNLTDTEASLLLRTDNRWYNAMNTISSNQAAIASFVNAFYFNDASSTNYWCPPFPVINSLDKTYVWFQEPYNYNGPPGSGNWTTYDPFDGQTERYCNFANNRYTYNLPDGSTGMKVQLFFELEAGKDFLNFFDASNNLIASFTGYEIAGSSFYTTTSTLTAQFISDNQSVFRGFYVSITPQ